MSLNFLGKSKPLILLHSGMESISTGEVVDIMLPPQLYTVKREHIDVKYLYQAKRLASSVLENFLQEDVDYDYFVYRDEDDWVFIAYSPKEIGDLLNRYEISTDQISKLYFAQQSRDRFDSPVRLGEAEALVTIKGSVTVVPEQILSASQRYQRFDDSFRPKGGISFGVGADSIFNKKDTLIITLIITLFGLMFFVEGLRYGRVVESMKSEISLLFVDHPTLQSGYARDNIIKKYRKIDKAERRKREVLKNISHLIPSGVEVENFLLEEKKIAVVLRCADRQSSIRVESLAKAKGYKVTRVGSENLIKIESKL